ncbi:hypothetical protein M8Z33_10505 [Streptomyces sp. ZAF1911]|uniref:hypothetical protein n=1 Tax=Streptomyces sp. ZAF1911 TaxID=2944129 RepID=UPI00237C0D18|nr:hypothetical protein [Streptomyces sp. ZAF1911]MDD9377094.1 hypothetical protein [Streptomyces sp. ZAF1911]
MNSFKRTMTAVGTAVALAAVGVLTAPAAHAAPGAAPAAQRALPAADPEAKALGSRGVYASFFQRANNEFIVYVDGITKPSRVEVRRAGTDKVVAVVDDLTYYEEGAGESGVEGRDWFQGDKQPLVLDDMADYELDVYAKPANGPEAAFRNAGRSTYALAARFEAKSSRQEFSLDALDTQVTGSVTAVHPRTGERLPLAGAQVRARLGDGYADGVSDAQGKFTTTVAALGTEKSLTHTVALASGDTEVSVTAPSTIRAQKSVLTLTSTAPLTARYGTAVPVRGKLTRVADDGTVKPAAGQSVTATGVGGGEATVAPDGSYTLLPPIFRTGAVNVAVATSSWLIGDGSRTATVAKLTHTTKVVEDKLVSTDKYGRLTLGAKITVDGITGQQAPVDIQFRTSNGQWITKLSLVVPYNKPFTATVAPSRWYDATGWRVHTPGTKNIGPSTGTRVFTQNRAETRISGERFAPLKVVKGKQLSVSGVLRTSTPEGLVPYTGKKVRYYFRPDGSTVWKEMGTSVSGAYGAVSMKFTAQTSGSWLIRFVDADATHLISNGREGRIEVTG